MKGASELIEAGFEVIPPGNPRLDNIEDKKARYFAIGRLPRAKHICKWCFKKPTKTFRHKYCSTECNLSAQIWCYPQAYWSRYYLLKKHNRTCNHCKEKLAPRDKGEIDHINPIFKGGEALGPNNLQILCSQCHLKKTISERKAE